MVETNPMYDPGCNHDLPIPGPGCNRDMWTCRYPECTYPEAAPRRVRTQAERDADDHAWRAAAASRPGYATYLRTAPGSPSWWRRSVLRVEDPAETERWERDKHPAGPPPVDGETLRAAFAESAATGKPVLLADGSAEVSAYQPRRRWWHRLTRRNP